MQYDSWEDGWIGRPGEIIKRMAKVGRRSSLALRNGDDKHAQRIIDALGVGWLRVNGSSVEHTGADECEAVKRHMLGKGSDLSIDLMLPGEYQLFNCEKDFNRVRVAAYKLRKKFEFEFITKTIEGKLYIWRLL